MEDLLKDYGFVGWIIIGGLAGLIARAVTPGPQPSGCIVTILLGVFGAVLAGWLGHELHWYTQGEKAGFLAAILGAIIILAIYSLVNGRRRL